MNLTQLQSLQPNIQLMLCMTLPTIVGKSRVCRVCVKLIIAQQNVLYNHNAKVSVIKILDGMLENNKQHIM